VKEERRQSFHISLIIAVLAAIVLFGVVLVYPALSSAITGRSYVPVFWDLGFGLLWWASDVFLGKIDGPVAGMAFLIWPLLFATVIMALVCRVYVRASRNTRILVILLMLASLLVVIPLEYNDKGSAFPLWHKYLFITF